MRRHVLPLLTLFVLVGPGCDNGKDAKKATKAKAAADARQKEKEQTEANVAKRKAEREEREEAKAAMDEKRAAEFTRLAELPDPLPKKAPSCEEVAEAQDAFLRRVGDADAVAKWDGGGKESEMPMTIVRCTQADSNKVAICQKHALDEAGAEMLGYEKELLQKCIEKFGKAGGRAGVVPRKPGR